MKILRLAHSDGSATVGDSVPKPLGFSAFPPEWLFRFLGRQTPPRHSGRWIGARVASLRRPILRPGERQYTSQHPREKARPRNMLQKLSLVRYN
jgi:hypothetical protein